MATILVVDDRPVNREFFATLLGYKGHRVLEAGDGAEALELVRADRPHLVISDILMPTMDGYEFVRRLRAEPDTADIPVVFSTAHYLDREARSLAEACGVMYTITKPAEPEAVLRTVDAALGIVPSPAPSPPEQFDREHLRLLTDKLAEKTRELTRVNERLTAVIDLGQQLAAERDPLYLLEGFCHSARRIVGAKYSTTLLSTSSVAGWTQRLLRGSGLLRSAWGSLASFCVKEVRFEFATSPRIAGRQGCLQIIRR